MEANKIKPLFQKIKEAHDIYVRCSLEKQNAIVKAYQPIFDQLEQLGVDQGFSIGLLIGGREFINSIKEHEQQSLV